LKDNDMPTIGDNHPPSPIVDLAATLSPEILHASIEADFTVEQERVKALLAAKGRFEKLLKDTDGQITSASIATKAADFVKQVKETIKDIEAKREAYKRPVITAGKTIDAAFKNPMISPLQKVVDEVMYEINGYQVRERQAEAKRQKQQAEAEAMERRKAADAEAARLAEEAAAAEAAGDVESAMEIESAAQQVAEVARVEARQVYTPQAADIRLATQKSDLGTGLGTRVTWDFELVDIALVPKMFVSLNVDMVKAMLKSDKAIKEDGAQPIPGVRFFSKQSASVR
jgi:hypothetical protein